MAWEDCIGTFESNMLSCITPLGKKTKSLAILGMPLGIVLITVGVFAVTGLVESQNDDAAVVLRNSRIVTTTSFGIVLTAVMAGLLLFKLRIYEVASLGTHTTMRMFLGQLKQWAEWLPWLSGISGALMIDMFLVSLFSPGMVLYLYVKPLSLYIDGASMNSDLLKAVYNAMFCCGDVLGRKLMYDRQRRLPFLFLIISAVGICCGLSSITYIIPVCAFCIAFANGAIYAQSARYIDQNVPIAYNLVSLSVWLFVGDIGSVIGSNALQKMLIGVEQLPWFITTTTIADVTSTTTAMMMTTMSTH